MGMLRPWQLGGVAAVVVIIIAAIFGVPRLFGGSEGPDAADGIDVAVAQEQPASRDIRVNGSLVFPNRVELTFDTTGEVGEVLVQEGERVSAGQVLARLNDLTVTALEQKLAKAQKEADDARENFEDYQGDYEQTLATRMTAKVQAEVALDNALEQLSYYRRDQVSDSANAIEQVSAKELALEIAREKLANFESDFQESVGDARLARADAEAAFDTAEDNLNDFLRKPTRDIVNDRIMDLELLQRFRDAFEEASTNLKQAEDALADLDNDWDLGLQNREVAVAQAESDLALAQDNLRDVGDLVDQSLILQERQAAVAQAQADLAVAEENLADQTDGPDQLEVGVKQAAAAAAQAAVDDALEELEGSVVRAPFAGIISLVNVEVEDKVNDKSRVLEIIDTSDLEVDGLLDAIDIPFVAVGATAKISIASVPGQEFEGTVLRVAEEPRTERGVVSYPVRIKVDLPAGVEVPPKLSAVSSTITYQRVGGG